MKIILRFLMCGSIIILSAGCSQTRKSTSTKNISGNNVSLNETYWKLTELMGQPVSTTSTDNKEVHIKFIKEGNKVEGFGGCNGFGGNYDTKNNFNISITNIISTMIACPQLEMENQLFNVLKTADNYYINGDTLSLSKAKMATMARFVALHSQ